MHCKTKTLLLILHIHQDRVFLVYEIFRRLPYLIDSTKENEVFRGHFPFSAVYHLQGDLFTDNDFSIIDLLSLEQKEQN